MLTRMWKLNDLIRCEILFSSVRSWQLMKRRGANDLLLDLRRGPKTKRRQQGPLVKAFRVHARLRNCLVRMSHLFARVALGAY